MDYKTARAYVMQFGKYTGRTLDEIASTDAGLRYLDWMRGALRLDFHTKNAVEAYLDDPTISADLEKLIKKESA